VRAKSGNYNFVSFIRIALAVALLTTLSGCGSPLTSTKKFIEGLITGDPSMVRRYSTAEVDEQVADFSPFIAIIKKETGKSGRDLWDEIAAKSSFTLETKESGKATVIWEYENIIKARLSLVLEKGVWVVKGWDWSGLADLEENEKAADSGIAQEESLD
jgi:hypothetical protein